jgi:hypothetical protein
MRRREFIAGVAVAATAGVALPRLARGAASPASSTLPKAVQWPEADVLFRREPRWLGGDAAYSVPLNDGRILWMFGDTLISKSDRNSRAESALIHNSVAIQKGDDPVTAAMTFHWRSGEGGPASFFPDEGDRWYWPQHGIRLGKELVLFLMRVRPGAQGTFETDGWRAAVIDDADGEPTDWKVRIVAPTGTPPGIVFGAMLYREGRVYALGQRDPGDHSGYLMRWTEDDIASGRVAFAEWWADTRGWINDVRVAPTPVMPNTGPGGSLHYDLQRRRWLAIRSDGFGASNIVVATADRPIGPFTQPQAIFRPPESDRPRTLVYGAKAHPELAAGGALALTYTTNSFGDLAALIGDTSLYYPRFVKLPK